MPRDVGPLAMKDVKGMEKLLYPPHEQDHVMPVSGVQGTDLHAGFSPSVNELPIADIDADMSWNFVVFESAGNREEDQIAGLQVGSFNRCTHLCLILGQTGKTDPEAFEYMAGKGRAVELFGLFVSRCSEIVRGAEKLFRERDQFVPVPRKAEDAHPFHASGLLRVVLRLAFVIAKRSDLQIAGSAIKLNISLQEIAKGIFSQASLSVLADRSLG